MHNQRQVWWVKVRAVSLTLTTVALLLPSLCLAGEPTPVEAPAAAAAPTEAVDPPFNFDPTERRDPFTFTKAIVQDDPTIDSALGPNRTGHSLISRQQIEAKKKEAEAAYLRAEEELGKNDPTAVLASCDKGLEAFKDVPNIMEYPELQVARENLFRIRKAADRLRQRQDADREFGRLNLKVTGVVAREKNSQAIINGDIVGKGDVVTTIGENNEAVVIDEILPNQVVFLFRGYRMALLLSEIGR